MWQYTMKKMTSSEQGTYSIPCGMEYKMAKSKQGRYSIPCSLDYTMTVGTG